MESPATLHQRLERLTQLYERYLDETAAYDGASFWGNDKVTEIEKEIERTLKQDGWYEGFTAGWKECKDPGVFVNDEWDSETPNPYNKG